MCAEFSNDECPAGGRGGTLFHDLTSIFGLKARVFLAFPLPFPNRAHKEARG